VLDAVFVANRVSGWESKVSIRQRDGDELATSETFHDTTTTTDHRPLLLEVKSDATDRLEELREIIADMEATLERWKAEVERLEENQ